MARGGSGRIVLEIDPDTKRTLYESLDARGLTLKRWFLDHVHAYLRDSGQHDLFDELDERALSHATDTT